MPRGKISGSGEFIAVKICIAVNARVQLRSGAVGAVDAAGELRRFVNGNVSLAGSAHTPSRSERSAEHGRVTPYRTSDASWPNIERTSARAEASSAKSFRTAISYCVRFWNPRLRATLLNACVSRIG